MERRDFDSLFREIGPGLWRAIYIYSGGRREIADDAVAEAFARAIEHEAKIRNVFQWMYRVAGRYWFQDDVHPTSHGLLIVE